jgi:hypothetical protein
VLRKRLGVAVGLGALWLVAASAQAAPQSEPEAYAGALAPVWIEPSSSVTPSPAPDLRVATPGILVDAADAPPAPSTRPRLDQPNPAAVVDPKPTPKPKPKPQAPRVAARSTGGGGGGSGSGGGGRHSLSGRASWYCRAGVSICMAIHPDRAGVADMYAAAGPRLRRAICGRDTSNCWRGRRVTVNGVRVVLADWCQCYKGQAQEKIIDLYWDAWTRVPHVTSGVTIRW